MQLNRELCAEQSALSVLVPVCFGVVVWFSKPNEQKNSFQSLRLKYQEARKYRQFRPA